MAAAAVMRASHRAARVTAAPAAALRSLSREVRDNEPLTSNGYELPGIILGVAGIRSMPTWVRMPHAHRPNAPCPAGGARYLNPPYGMSSSASSFPQ